MTYDANPHTATGACYALDGTTELTGLDLSLTTHADAGTYNGDAWTFTDVSGNYNNDSGTVDDAIGKADANCSAITGYNGVYDAAPHGATGSLLGRRCPRRGSRQLTRPRRQIHRRPRRYGPLGLHRRHELQRPGRRRGDRHQQG